MVDSAEHIDGGGRRRRAARRGGAGLAFGTSASVSDSTSGEGVGSLNEELLDEIVSSPPPGAVPRRALPPLSEATTGNETHIANAEEFTPQNRLAQVRGRSTEYEREYRLDLIHRMILRKLPQDEMANTLGISMRQLQRDIADLRDKLRADTKSLDIEGMIGHSKGFYEEVQAMAMRAATNNSVAMPMRLAAMRTALASHNDMHRFFQAAGVYDVLRFKKGAGDGAQTDIQRLMLLTDELLVEARNPRRPEGNTLGEFSGTDEENMSL